MSIAEYQVLLKNIIDATTDEALLKRWHSQLQGDVQTAKNNLSDKEQSTSGQQVSEEQQDTSDYVIKESGLGIDE
ncbi:MAG: hypothetical protein EON98_03095 [Chitinophagaceae bacterium]|nr:MAG: hypothetical protein EON98_03095 [Chitinophagaceae bacterium]